MAKGNLIERCPICGSELVVLEYRGKKRKLLRLAGSDGFCGFLGCNRADLHDKVVDGVSWRGKVYIYPVFHPKEK
jgi:hypothetical protein